MIDKMKQSKPYPKPTTKMVIDQTLRGYYAMNAPDVPDWFRSNQEGNITIGQYVYQLENGKIPEEVVIVTDEELFLKWLEYYSELMIKHFSK